MTASKTVEELEAEIADLKQRLHWLNETAMEYRDALRLAQAEVRKLEWQLEIRQ